MTAKKSAAVVVREPELSCIVPEVRSEYCDGTTRL